MTYWVHEVSPAWLAERKQVVTATDLVDLRSGFTKLNKGQKAGEKLAPAFMALWGKKNSLVPDDPMSSNKAARGHWMEPYAVRDFSEKIGEEYHHWDDCIICNGEIGFSPDGMDIKQECPYPARMDYVEGIGITDGVMELPSPRKILEVKCYDIPAHMTACATPKEQLKERWQVAGAFLVLPTLEKATIVFYCPLTSWGVDYKEYTREELKDEIEELEELLEVWEKQKHLIEHKWQPEMVCDFTEEEIVKDFADFMSDGIIRKWED